MFATPLTRPMGRRISPALHPTRESKETLDRLRAQMGSAAFLAQYQQAPCPREGVMIKTRWFPRYELNELPRDFEQRVISCDTANKASELSDYTVFTVWGVKNKHLWLLSVLSRRMEYYELKRVLKEQIALHRANVVLIEDRASGTQLLQELKFESVAGVTACEPAGDKQMRLWAQCATMEQGLVHLPKEAPWLDDYLRELTSFPNSKHDDQVDSTTQAIQWFSTPSPMQGWFDLARKQRFNL